MSDLRICFAGTPEFAAAHLSALIEDQLDVCCVYTQPDRPAGRGKKLQASPVKALAMQHGIEVRQPVSLKTEVAQQELRDLQPDLLIVVAYGLILPKEILNIPRLGCVNVHASLLPRWRGAAPIERAILAGDKESGVTIMLMDEGLDTGPMLYTDKVSIEDHDDRISLTQKLTESGTKALVHVVSNFEEMLERQQIQDDSQSNYAAKMDKSESEVVWEAGATEVNRTIRAGIGRAPAYSFVEGERIRLLEANVVAANLHVTPGTIMAIEKQGMDIACQNSVLRVTRVQLPGKKPWSAADLANANSPLLAVGKQFDKEAAG